MWAVNRSTTHDAVLSPRVGVAATSSANQDLIPDLAIDRSIASVNFKDLLFEVFFTNLTGIPKKFPHRLAGEGEMVDLLF